MKNALSVICDFSDLNDVSFHIVINDNSDLPILVNRRGVYLESFLCLYSDVDCMREVLKTFKKIQDWFNAKFADSQGHYPMVTFISEFKLRGFEFTYHYCLSQVDDVENYQSYATTFDSLEVIKEYLRLKNL